MTCPCPHIMRTRRPRTIINIGDATVKDQDLEGLGVDVPHGVEATCISMK